MLSSTVRRRVRPASFMLAAVLAIVCTEAAFAKDAKLEDVAQQVAALESLVSQQAASISTFQADLADAKATIGTQQTAITALQTDLAAAKQVTVAVGPLAQYLTFDEDNNIYLTGANLNIRSGSGRTYGAVNGLGNLIIGYNESDSDTRTGSHNLVVGPYQSYSSYGGFLAGFANTISGPFSSVSGGAGNTASGPYSSVSGGGWNTASGDFSSVSGGAENTASGYASSVSGGLYGTASGKYSGVSGGRKNTASGDTSSVSGGYQGTASATMSSVSGGYKGIASGYVSSVIGGKEAKAEADFSIAPQ